MSQFTPRLIFAGQLTQDYIIPLIGQPQLNIPGGNLLYAAVGAAIWKQKSGLIARVGENYPQDWLAQLSELGFETRGIRLLPETVDMRLFTAFLDENTASHDNPIEYFSRRGVHFPKQLLGYAYNELSPCSRTRLLFNSIRAGDIPADYIDANAAHICPIDYLTHNLLPSVLLKEGHVTTITLDPADGYMNSVFWNDIPGIVSFVTAFLPSERQMRELFKNRTTDLWEMAEEIGSYGCEYVVVKCGSQGQILYDSVAKNRWNIPAYPAKVINPIGGGDAFCGGFLAGYLKTFDPLQAALYGNISASIVVEGNNPFYALDALPGLAEARFEFIKGMVQKV